MSSIQSSYLTKPLSISLRNTVGGGGWFVKEWILDLLKTSNYRKKTLRVRNYFRQGLSQFWVFRKCFILLFYLQKNWKILKLCVGLIQLPLQSVVTLPFISLRTEIDQCWELLKIPSILWFEPNKYWLIINVNRWWTIWAIKVQVKHLMYMFKTQCEVQNLQVKHAKVCQTC